MMPAEWYPQSGVQLTWPHRQTDWAPCLDAITRTYVELAGIISRHEKVLIATPEPQAVDNLLRERLDAAQMERIVICQCRSNDTWARDHGAITLVGGDGPVLVDFRFNGWGEKFPSGLDNAITACLYGQGVFDARLKDAGDFVLEGGSIESDGKGTVFTTSQCLLAPHRNQPLCKDEIERRLKSELGAERVVWLDHGNLAGDDTDGHIDTIVRPAPADTLLYMACNDPADEQYEDFGLLKEQVQRLRTTEGRPYRLLELPMPAPIYNGEDRLPATYANFLVINGAVIVPTYGQPQTDELALSRVAQAFDGYEIYGVDARTIIRQHGSIHCITMQYPQGVIR